MNGPSTTTQKATRYACCLNSFQNQQDQYFVLYNLKDLRETAACNFPFATLILRLMVTLAQSSASLLSGMCQLRFLPILLTVRCNCDVVVPLFTLYIYQLKFTILLPSIELNCDKPYQETRGNVSLFFFNFFITINNCFLCKFPNSATYIFT